MKNKRKIYMPQMLHYHNELLCAAFRYGGYNLDVVPEQKEFCHETYSFVGKDYCTCAIGIIGNILTFVKQSGEQADSIAFLEPQAGGACRAGNYYNLIIECLKKMGHENIPVYSLNFQGNEVKEGFSINAKLIIAAVAAVCYGDLLMCLTQQIKPYEINPGQTEALRQEWLKKLAARIEKGHAIVSRKKIYKEIVESFSKIEVDKTRQRTKVGIVGEIYIKFSPVGNCHLEDFLYNNNCEIRHGGFINYCAYVVYSEMMNTQLKEKNSPKKDIFHAGYQEVLKYLASIQNNLNEVLEQYNYKHDTSFENMLKIKGDLLDDHYNIGDGWLMSAEVMDLASQGYNKILIVHPFGCLVSHVGGRGIIKELNKLLPNANVTSIEFDYDQSKTLRESRILLAIS